MLYVIYVWGRNMVVCATLSCCAYNMCVFWDKVLVVALSVVHIRGMRVMMCEGVDFGARATLRLTPHSQSNVFLILSIPHHQSLFLTALG